MAAAQKRRFSDFLSSRDLNGRRLRDIKNEILMKEWVRKKRREEKALAQYHSDQHPQDNLDTQQTENAQRALKAALEVDREYGEKVRHAAERIRNAVREGVLGKREREEGESDHWAPGEEKKGVFSGFKVPEVRVKDIIGHQPQIMKKLKSTEAKEETKEEPSTSNKTITVLDFEEIKSFNQLEKETDPQTVKATLQHLGLKCGGTPCMRATRLWEVKNNPALLFNPKYIAKS